MVNLKENDHQLDLEDGTLYTKIQEKMLPQYCRWIKENQSKIKSLKKLKDKVAEEAEYQVQAAQIKKGIGSGSRTAEKIVSWK